MVTMSDRKVESNCCCMMQDLPLKGSVGSSSFSLNLSSGLMTNGQNEGLQSLSRVIEACALFMFPHHQFPCCTQVSVLLSHFHASPTVSCLAKHSQATHYFLAMALPSQHFHHTQTFSWFTVTYPTLSSHTNSSLFPYLCLHATQCPGFTCISVPHHHCLPP